MNSIFQDIIILSPKDIDLKYSPLQSLGIKTSVLGAFNPGLTELPHGNLLMMVRVAERLEEPIEDEFYRFIRWDVKNGFILDSIHLDLLDRSDPRKYKLKNRQHTTYGLTSFSWLLPVELNSDGTEVYKIHYDKIIQPEKVYQEYGIEDARITKVENKYYVTACAVSSYRHSTILYSSEDGLNYNLEGIILDHQNKDMVIFPQKINGYYYALTRPVGDHYFQTKMNSQVIPGPSICMTQSPDLLHWKPVENFILQPTMNSAISEKLGGGANPILTNKGWLVLFHGVETQEVVGRYTTLSMMLNKEQPNNIEWINIEKPTLKAFETLPDYLEKISYVEDVVFTTGIVEKENYFVVASGERDLCCRITQIEKSSLLNIN